MSFILDALRKSEIERQRQSGPSMAEFPLARQDRRLPVALIAIGFLLAVNLAVVLFFMLRSDKDSEVAAAATQVAGAAPASVTSPPPATAGTAAPAQAPAGMPVPQDGLQGAPGGPGSVTYAQSDLYGDSATLPPDAPDPTLVPDADSPTGSGVTYGPSTGTEEAAMVESQLGLPPLSVDLHVFVDDPSKRAVFINGRRYTQGATIAEGPTVEQITREGAVLSYRGRRFLLPRL
jgi:general secretion pathway protein B